MAENGRKWPKMLSLARIRTCTLQTAKKMSEIQTKALHCATEATLIVIHIYENQLICACLLLKMNQKHD